MANKYLQLTRDIYQKVIIGDNEIVDEFISAKVTKIGSKNNALTVGDFCANYCEFEYRGSAYDWKNYTWELIVVNNEETDLLVGTFKVGTGEVVREGREYSLGVFVTSTVEYDGYKYKVTGYNLPPEMFETYTLGTGNSNDIVNRILDYVGIVGNLAFSDFEITEIPESISNMEMLGYIAGYDGLNLKVNRYGEVESYWYSSRETKIARDYQYENQLNQNTKIVTIGAVKCGELNQVGTGYPMIINNPFITQERLNYIYNKVNGFSYAATSLRYRGYPGFEIGDIIQAETETASYISIPVMEQVFNFDGGMNATIYSYDNETELELIPISPIDKKVNEVVKETKTYSQAILNTIVGAGNGFYQIINDEFNPVGINDYAVGWQNTNTQEITNETKGWRFLLGGLYHSSDGFNSYDTFALDEDGNINASAINVGEMSASLISGGQLVMGGEENGNGEIWILDSDSNLIGTWNNEGLIIYKGIIEGSIINVGGNGDTKGEIVLLGYDDEGIGVIDNRGVWFESLTENNDTIKTFLNNEGLLFQLTNEIGVEKIGNITIFYDESDEIYKMEYNSQSEHIFRGYDDLISMIINDTSVYTYVDLIVNGNFSVIGTKSRIVGTEDYGNRLLYAYETPVAMFGDVGETVINEDGFSYVWLDSVFMQTISNDSYQVFLQKYGDGDCYVKERTKNYFIVAGTPGLNVGWEIKARQKDYEQQRLDKERETITLKNKVNYSKEADDYIKTLKEGRLNA